ncbi:Actin, indirect flight muscle, partial [Gryllus bimaculatus]
MSADMLYGGDDIGALVFDVGHYSLRVGHAQDSTPKAEIPAVVGISEETESFPCFDEDEKWLDGKQNPFDNNGKKYYVDTNFVHVAKERMELLRYMKDGMIHDWDLFEKVLDYAYERVIQSEPHFHPVLMSEASWNEAEKREKLTEIMFEKYNVPAFFLAKNSVLAAFANGRTTGIVVDSGATHTSAVPVEDGFVLKKAIVRSPIGGDYITSLCETFLKEKVGVQIIPSYLISTKETVKEREKPLWTRKKHVPEVTSSWHEYMEFKVVQDFQMSVLQVCETPFDARVVATVPAAHYEFPDGYHQEFGAERFSIAEALFAPGAVPAPALALAP